MSRDGHVVPADPGAVVLGKKKSMTVARSWIMMDGAGEGTVLDVDKYAIMHRANIHARDLRILDPLLSYPSAILGRDKAIVLNLEVFNFSPFLSLSLSVSMIFCFDNIYILRFLMF
jgi:magnesium transporter